MTDKVLFDILVPQLIADPFVIRPQLIQDNESDFRAVMANRDWLRRWSGSPWPEDDFTEEENRRDLAEHIDDHRSKVALGFSVASRTDDEILGSLYVQELSDWLDDYAAARETRNALAAIHARVDLWTRLDRDDDLLATVVSAATSWFATHWEIKTVWCARANCPELERAYQAAGLRRIAELKKPKTGRLQHLYLA